MRIKCLYIILYSIAVILDLIPHIYPNLAK